MGFTRPTSLEEPHDHYNKTNEYYWFGRYSHHWFVDTLLTPIETHLHEDKLLTLKWMEWMGDGEHLYRIVPIRYS